MAIATVSKTDVFHFGADFYNRRRPFYFKIFDHGDGVAILQDVAIGIFNDGWARSVLGFFSDYRLGIPLKRTLGTDPQVSIFVNIFRLTFWALSGCLHALVESRGPGVWLLKSANL